MSKNRRYTNEFKREVLAMAASGEKSIPELGSDLGINATLKTECVTQRYASRALARRDIFEYIEVWYNRQRRHSALGYLSPAAFEQLHL